MYLFRVTTNLKDQNAYGLENLRTDRRTRVKEVLEPTSTEGTD